MLQQPSVQAPPDVVVSVDPSGQHVVCTPNPVVVSAKNATLVFQLVTSGYSFRDQDPIVVKGGVDAFPYPSKSSGTTATLYDRDNSTASYKYSVYVKDQATGRVISVDPTIENQPE